MKNVEKMIPQSNPVESSEQKRLEGLIRGVWALVAPTWPLKNLIAVNPLSGFEDVSFEEALRQGRAYFQQRHVPAPMGDINRQTIKWLQAFFDEGQATIPLPLRREGLFSCVFSLLLLDGDLRRRAQTGWGWMEKLPRDPHQIISECLVFLGVPPEDQEQFLTLQLTTLPGWAAYIKYKTDWAAGPDALSPQSPLQGDYLALRLVLTCLIWPQAKDLLEWHDQALKQADVHEDIAHIAGAEADYHKGLMDQLTQISEGDQKRPAAQLVFCIDVRSEPLRRALESQGNYETYGFPGFFGIPVNVASQITGETHASCPVLLKTAYQVSEAPASDAAKIQKTYDRNRAFKKLGQSLKYTFATPFTLVEVLGAFAGLLMAWRNFFPNAYHALKRTLTPSAEVVPNLETIPFEDQLSLAAGALRAMGLTQVFAPLVVFCGHGSETQNNAYASALDCGACGGHHGGPNARMLASILNKREIVLALGRIGIKIPEDTYFVAAEHNTTTDEVALYSEDAPESYAHDLNALRSDLEKAKNANSLWRLNNMEKPFDASRAGAYARLRARDWAQVRPEWGLARNAAFIVGPRALTRQVNLEGRCFLHSYDWTQDPEGVILTGILTAPMVIAQWINAQYLFSTLDNVAYGGGSKISKNITGKIGIMQGNASDLMHGLPLQSVYKNDLEAYHQPIRLMTVVYAPRRMLDSIIASEDILKKLFGKGWVVLACIEVQTGEKFMLGRDFSWHKPN